MTSSSRVAIGLVLSVVAATPAFAQHLSIPFLAGAPQPGLIAFEGAECDADAGGEALRCAFQQVFLTTEKAPPDTCMITTNAYDLVFRRASETRWVSRASPEGVCGIVETVTLDDGGGVRWTMTITSGATRTDAAPECRDVRDTRDVMTWQDVRRPLPCTYVQPGGLRR